MSSALTGASQAGASSDPALDATMRSEARSLSAFFVMRKLQPFQQRVEAARKAEFAAAAATRAAQRALVEEEEGCGLKRRKVEVEEHDDNWKEWAHSDWVRMETWARNRRAVELRDNVWKEDKFTVTPKAGQREREKRPAETRAEELPKAKPGEWGCVQVARGRIERQPSSDCLHALLIGCLPRALLQARELWSTKEEIHLRPGHHWLFEFGNAGDGTCIDKPSEHELHADGSFKLAPRKWVEYKGVRFYNGDMALVVKRWLHRVETDASALTFTEWDETMEKAPDAPTVGMIVNSSELRVAGFKLQELLPPELESVARKGMKTRGAGLKRLEGSGPTMYRLDVQDDNEFRSRCE